jgi:hypothetical protein
MQSIYREVGIMGKKDLGFDLKEQTQHKQVGPHSSATTSNHI